MSSIKCGNCRGTHESVAEVRACYAGGTQTPKPENRTDPHPNRYAGTCQTCKSWVTAMAGHIEKVDGNWRVFHNSGDCVAKMAEVPSMGMPEEKETPRASWEDFKDIPAGYYATPSLTGHNDYDFWKVERPEEGRWVGYIFIKRVIGGRDDANIPKDSKKRITRKDVERVAKITQSAALQAILDFGIEKAHETFGTELKYCRVCGIHLTDETSRSLGIGPVCRA